MSKITPLRDNNLHKGFVTADASFTFSRVLATKEADGRTYALIQGAYKGHLFTEAAMVYAVATPETRAGGWRIALLTEQHSHGFNYLIYQHQEPRFIGGSRGAVLDLVCTEGGGRIVRRNILQPYTLPITAGSELEGKLIAEVGSPIFHGDNTSAIVPVRFTDETCGIVNCNDHNATIYRPLNIEADRLITRSTQLPIIRPGIAVSVWHIVVHENQGLVLIKSYYNDKSWRAEEVLR